MSNSVSISTHQFQRAIRLSQVKDMIDSLGIRPNVEFKGVDFIRLRNEDAQERFRGVVEKHLKTLALTKVFDDVSDDDNIVRHFLVSEDRESKPHGHMKVTAIDSGELEISYIGSNASAVKRAFDNIIKDCEVFEAPAEESAVATNFSYYTSMGVQYRRNDVICPKWSEISENYHPEVVESIDKIMLGNLNTAEGRVIIWWGEPGTGKTHAILSLMRSLADTHYPVVITDPIKFLEHIDYYYSILGDVEKSPLIILEDAANALLTENRRAFGEQIGTLLNLTDGLLAQGKEAIFVITFNEDVAGIDKAVTRAGRCLNQTKFLPFGPTQSMEWLKRKGIEMEVGGITPISDLYKIYRSHDGEETCDVNNTLASTTGQQS